MTGVVREYLYSGGEAPAAMRSRNPDGSYSNYFFVTNTHGDVVAVTDGDGTIVNRYAYGPWGEATRVSESVHQPFRYAGYFYEPTADLYWLRARWMDPNTGRFLSRDSYRGSRRSLGSLNRYVYASCNAPSLIDPTGHKPRGPIKYEAQHNCRARGFDLRPDNDYFALWRIIGDNAMYGWRFNVNDINITYHRFDSGALGEVHQFSPREIHLNEDFRGLGWCNFTNQKLETTYHELTHLYFDDPAWTNSYENIIRGDAGGEDRAEKSALVLMDLTERWLVGEISLGDIRKEYRDWVLTKS